MNVDDGGPAFPLERLQASGLAMEAADDEKRFMYLQARATCGMSLRDWFAGQALAGLLAAGTYPNFEYSGDTTLASQCYLLARAMVIERAMLSRAAPDVRTQAESIIRADETFAARMPSNGDIKEDHSAADELLCELLTTLGYIRTVAAFRELPKW